MNPLHVFPFKYMQIIVALLAEGEVDLSEIRSSTGMCSFDSTEVSDMLAYLTGFGRVEAQDDGWVIHKTETKAVYERFRKAFLDDAVAILTNLSTKAKPIEQLQQKTGLSAEKINLYLPFLADITRLGVIGRCSTEHPTIWCVQSE
ncbi:MAG: hypothetical protein ACFFBR_02855 [Promethearchaeota archaeon]